MSDLFIFIATKTTAPVALPTRAFDQGAYNRQIANTLKTFNGGQLTVGDLKLRPNGDAIPNHLLCDGAAIGRTAFPELFALLGTSEGAGDGSTTFNLPNYLGAPVEIPATAPPQVVTPAATVETDKPIVKPTTPAQTGGTTGGNTVSGGRPAKELLDRNDTR